MATLFPHWKKQYSKVIQGRLFASLLKQITFLLSTCEQLPGTHREQGLAVVKFIGYVFRGSTFKTPTSWVISNLTHDVVRKITCQVALVVVASQRWRMCDLYTETRRLLIGLKQGEVNGSDRPIYFTPLTSEACGEPHSLFSVSLGHASPAASAFLFGVHELCGGTATGQSQHSQNNLLGTIWQLLLLLACQRALQKSVLRFCERICSPGFGYFLSPLKYM